MTSPLLLRTDRALGEGGLAVVRQVLDPVRGRHYALKQLLEDKRYQPLQLAHHAEAWIMSRLHHRVIPSVHAYDADSDAFLMDMVPGVTLDLVLRELSRNGAYAMPLPVRLRLAEEITEALAEIHRHGFVHLDLKLTNMLLTGWGRLHVIDFGVTGLHWVNLAAGGGFPEPVTPQYAAPEQIDPGTLVGGAAHLDLRADLYALGVVLYNLLTGQQPYRVDGEKRSAVLDQLLNVRVIPPSTLAPELPRAVDAVVLACLAKDRADRPREAAVVLNGLREASGGLGAAGDAELQGWAAGLLAEPGLASHLPEVWMGEGDSEPLSLSAEDGVPEPRVPGVVQRIEHHPDEPTVGQPLELTWECSGGATTFQVHLMRPGDAEELVVVTTEPRVEVVPERAGTLRCVVRGVERDFVGPPSAYHAVRVLSGSVLRDRPGWVVAGAAAMVLIAVVVALAWPERQASRRADVVAELGEQGESPPAPAEGVSGTPQGAPQAQVPPGQVGGAVPTQPTSVVPAPTPVPLEVMVTSDLGALEGGSVISGTASGPVERVTLQIAAPGYRWWNGSGWVAKAQRLAASGTSSWRYQLAPSFHQQVGSEPVTIMVLSEGDGRETSTTWNGRAAPSIQPTQPGRIDVLVAGVTVVAINGRTTDIDGVPLESSFFTVPLDVIRRENELRLASESGIGEISDRFTLTPAQLDRLRQKGSTLELMLEHQSDVFISLEHLAN